MDNKVLDILHCEKVPCCRICIEPETPDSRLASPCKCLGNMQYVHPTCILEWIHRSKSQVCNLCKHKIKLKRVHTDKHPTKRSVLLFIASYVIYIMKKAKAWAYNRYVRPLHTVFSALLSLVFFMCRPVSKIFTLSVLSPFLSVSCFMRRKHINTIHKQNSYTLLETMTKLSMFSEYNAMYAELSQNILLGDQNKGSIKTPEQELRKIFNVIIFEEDPESIFQLNYSPRNYFVFFISLAVVSVASHFLIPVDDLQNGLVFVNVMLSTAILLLIMYVTFCLCNIFISLFKISSKCVNISIVYCKLLIIIFLRYVMLPYFVSSVVGYASRDSVHFLLARSECSIALRKMCTICDFKRHSAFLSRHFGAYLLISFDASSFKRLEIFVDMVSVFFVLFGNALIALLEAVSRRVSWLVRPGMCALVCPLDVFISRIIKDSILDNIVGYFVIVCVFACISMGVYVPVYCIHYLMKNEYLLSMKKDAKAPLETVAWMYYYVPLFKFLLNGVIQAYIGSIKDVFSTITQKLSHSLKIGSLLFDGTLPHIGDDLRHLHYLPSRNSVPYNKEEIRKRRRLLVTQEEKNMYFDKKGHKRHITGKRFVNLDAEDKEWAVSVMGARRAELLYNPLYSLFYVPPFAILRVLLYIFVAFLLFCALSIAAVLSLYEFFVCLENFRRERAADLIPNVLQNLKSVLFVISTSLAILCASFRKRRFLVIVKMRYALSHCIVLCVLPFVSLLFTILFKMVFVEPMGEEFSAHSGHFMWAVSYAVSLDILLRNSSKSARTLLQAAGALFLFLVFDVIICNGCLIEKSAYFKMCMVLFPFILSYITEGLRAVVYGILHLPKSVKTYMLHYGTEIALSETIPENTNAVNYKISSS
ncbi:hypothetical protein NEMIN01_0453 [Nematocida minor]|uniref:uncharacterized protein n=1 Tax=Nematocida minor TaxID=1912983 RepID=UPI00221E9D98|nr:uncharacterized protein NEMIN01_0453 [Nematocida minor]KAI5189390.1 hypothetical protein NEMIN01_0453 [Nematocida minor]